VKRSGRLARVKVSADGEGVVSHAGAELLRELAGFTGLIGAWDAALISTYKAMPIHFPGSVLADLAVAIADGADCISDLRALRDQPDLFGAVASKPTAWRVLDRVRPSRLPLVRKGRAMARERAWAAGAGPDFLGESFLDIDATIVIAHSDKEAASGTFKHTFGFHPLLCFLDRPEVASGEALSGILRPGSAGSKTAIDHERVLRLAIEALPAHARPRKRDLSSVRYVVRADAAGATHRFAQACVEAGCGFSFGFPITAAVRDAILALADDEWSEAIEEDGGVRDGALVAEVTRYLDLASWPVGSRVIVRKERPHPGAQLSLFDIEAGWRPPRSSAVPARVRGATSVRSPRSSCATGATHASRTGSARQRPRGFGTCCAGTSPRTRHGSSACSPRPTSCAGRSCSASPTIPTSHDARSRASATGSCMWPPASPARVGASTFASIATGPGPSSWRSASTACARRSPEAPTPAPGFPPAPSGSHAGQGLGPRAPTQETGLPRVMPAALTGATTASRRSSEVP